jgi:hypothetical protein
MERDALRMRDGGPFVFAQVGLSTLFTWFGYHKHDTSINLTMSYGSCTITFIFYYPIGFVQFEM